jgi:hypothetical protein
MGLFNIGESGTWYSMELCSRLAEARLRLAFIEATLSGHGASTGVINVSDQRYQNAVDGMENGMEDLEIRDGDLTAQIRIELVRIGPYKVK